MSTRDVPVPERGDGMRLDRFLAARFPDWSRSQLVRGIKAGQVHDASGRRLRASHTVRAGMTLLISIPGLAPTTPEPPLPPVLYEDEHVVVLDKPSGLSCHPGGGNFEWAVIGIARRRWPGIDLVHRLDRDTSGVLVLAKDIETNRFLKHAFKHDHPDKEYIALVRGEYAYSGIIDAPIDYGDGVIRIKMAVVPGGPEARTTVVPRGTRIAGGVTLTRVSCTLHTGRTHQIRVHLAHTGLGIVGDRMYGVPPEVFLRAWEHGVDEWVVQTAGAPRQALHAHRLAFDGPDGQRVDVTAPIPPDMARWWDDPSVLPMDRSGPAAAVSGGALPTSSRHPDETS